MVATIEISKIKFLELFSENLLDDITDYDGKKYAITTWNCDPDAYKVVYITL